MHFNWGSVPLPPTLFKGQLYILLKTEKGKSGVLLAILRNLINITQGWILETGLPMPYSQSLMKLYVSVTCVCVFVESLPGNADWQPRLRALDLEVLLNSSLILILWVSSIE